jgi:hypothetical protein
MMLHMLKTTYCQGETLHLLSLQYHLPLNQIIIILLNNLQAQYHLKFH